MEIIQNACRALALHIDENVVKTASEIADADLNRDSEHLRQCLVKDAAISTLSAKYKVRGAEIGRLKEQLGQLRIMLFAASSEQMESDVMPDLEDDPVDDQLAEDGDFDENSTDTPLGRVDKRDSSGSRPMIQLHLYAGDELGTQLDIRR